MSNPVRKIIQEYFETDEMTDSEFVERVIREVGAE
jgi:hypothetical protein